MWQLYAKEKGIAIQSTFWQLAQCFMDISRRGYVGVVRYINYDSDSALRSTPDGSMNTLVWVSHKRQSFEHERELRAVIDLDEPLQPGEEMLDDQGVYIPIVDVNALIQKVCVSPKSPDGFLERVRSAACTYKLTRDVMRSDLLKDPLY